MAEFGDDSDKKKKRKTPSGSGKIADKFAALQEHVRQLLEPYTSNGNGSNSSVRRFVTLIETGKKGDVDLTEFRKVLYSLGISADEAAYLLDQIDRKSTGRMTSKRFIPLFLKSTNASGSLANEDGHASSSRANTNFDSLDTSPSAPVSTSISNDEPMQEKKNNHNAAATARAISTNTPSNTTGAAPLTLQEQQATNEFHQKVIDRALVKYHSIKDAFRQYDSDKSGTLTYGQCRNFLKDLGFMNNQEVDNFIKYLDISNTQKISFSVFARIVTNSSSNSYLKSPQRKKKQPQALNKSSSSSTSSSTTSKQKHPAVVSNGPNEGMLILDPMEAVRTKFRQRVMGKAKSIREVFAEQDVDHNGSLDHEEFTRFMKSYGFTEGEISLTIDFLDKDHSQTIDYDEFSSGLLFYRPPPGSIVPMPSVLSITTKQQNKTAKAKANAKAKADANANAQNKVNNTEIKLVLDLLETKIQNKISQVKQFSRKEMEHSFLQYDTEKRGYLDVQEFISFLAGTFDVKLNLNEITTLVRLVDQETNGQQIEFEEFAALFSILNDTKENEELEDKEKIANKKKNKNLNDQDQVPKTTTKTTTTTPAAVKAQVPTATTTKTSTTPAAAVKSQQQRRISQLNQEEVKKRLAILEELEIEWMEEVLQHHISMENAFNEFDKERNGHLDYEQFRDLMGTYGISDETNVTLLLRKLDGKKHGTIEREVFLQLFNPSRLKPLNSNKDKASILSFSKTTTNSTIENKKKSNNNPVSMKRLTSSSKKNTIAVHYRELEENWIRQAIKTHGTIQNVFHTFDRNGKGELDHEEFTRLMNAFGIQEQNHVQTLLKRLDMDENGSIDFEEFYVIFHTARVQNEDDKDEHGMKNSKEEELEEKKESKQQRAVRLRELEVKWIKRVMSYYGSIEQAFYEYDMDQSGELDHEEFTNFMKRYGITRKEDIDFLIGCLDVNGSGTIDIEEFSTIFNASRVPKFSRSRHSSTLQKINLNKQMKKMKTNDLQEEEEEKEEEEEEEEDDDDEEQLFDNEELISILEIERKLAERMVQETRDLRLAFRRFDTNGNGTLEYKEFRTVLKMYKFPEKEIRKVIRHLDKNVSGQIDYKEFIAGFTLAPKVSPSKLSITSGTTSRSCTNTGKLKVVHAIDWRKSFKEDKKHLNKEQQQQRIESLKQNLLTRLSSNPDGNVQSAFQKYDQNGQGTLNEEQFQQLMYDHGFQNKKDAKLLFDFFDQTKSKSIGYHVFIKELNVVVEETEETEETEEEQQQQQQQQNTNKYTVD